MKRDIYFRENNVSHPHLKGNPTNKKNETLSNPKSGYKKTEENNKYNVMALLNELLDKEIKFENEFKHYNTIRYFIDDDTINKINSLYIYVRKNISKITVYLLKKGIDYNKKDELISIIVLLNLIKKLQEHYINFVYNRLKLIELEVFDTKQANVYQNCIEKELKKVNLNNN